jgi:serine/threonine protein kinase
MKAEHIRNCLVCGAQFPATKEFCPICILREALGGGVESAESSLEDHGSESAATRLSHRFEHYELVTNTDGSPVELGRGAMGITYKGFDVDLRCPVTLKVINERYLGDESARLRFLREARAAAKVRHSNVASVLHLGRTGNSYFYAMEFVEGETLERLISRWGRLEPKLALEIVSQVAAGLAAVHEQRLIHRDIKPSNIMVRLKDDGSVIVKIIDLGLAKAIAEPSLQTAISRPGGFVGTPDFASPEQFAGVQVDIRSDLYSVGVMLWEMLTGQALFRGSQCEVMYQHQHAPLPSEQLKGLPQAVIVLIEILLQKDPACRFQNPIELLKAMPAIVGAVEAGRRITRQRLQRMVPTGLRKATHSQPPRFGPKKVSIASLPVTGTDLFGREEHIAFLNDAWANKDANVVTIVAWAGVGKSTLVNHWLRRMAAEQYRSAQLIFGWSFYRQGTSGGSSSADEFLDAALTWFGDPDPRLGTAWEKGERLAKLVGHCRTLLILDGLEPLKNPPGAQEGRLREPSLQALVLELAAFNTRLCVITTRMPVADIADHGRTAVLRRNLEQLSSAAGAKLLRALGVKGDEAELRSASDQFSGHCLALTLLGSYLSDAYKGDIRCQSEVTGHLAHDIRQGVQAQKVMESYQTWFGEGPELSVLRMLGLFDRPADEKAFEVLLKPPAIPGLTESLTDLSPTGWRTVLARLRRAKLLAGEDPHNPGQLDTHPLVREHFGEQLRSQRTEAWKKCNKRLYSYHRTLAPHLPESFREMEPLFLAVICGCNADLYREALHEVYIPRIQRGDASFAANILGARGALLSILVHFFERGRWGSPAETAVAGQSLTAEDQLFILMQAGMYLAATRGLAASEARICYDRAESWCRSLNRPLLLYAALMGQWRHSTITERLSAALQIAKRIYALAQKQNEPAMMIGACAALAITHYFLGDLETSAQYVRHGLDVWRSGGVQSAPEEVDVAAGACLYYDALLKRHSGEIASSRATIEEAISLEKELNDMHGLAIALHSAAVLAQMEREPAEVERLASEVIELSTRQTFAHWLAVGAILRGWARSVLGNATEGISCIEDGIGDYRARGAILGVPYFLALKAEALHIANRTLEALQAIEEADALVEKYEEHIARSGLYRLRGVFLAALGAEDTQVEASFCEALNTAKEQKSVWLEKCAEATYAEYRRQKGSAAGERVFRLPLW